MPKFRKSPLLFDATQWYPDAKILNGIVTPFSDPGILETDSCAYCNYLFKAHGFIDNFLETYRVCPGDWVVRINQGQYRVMKPEVFELEYEEVEE